MKTEIAARGRAAVKNPLFREFLRYVLVGGTAFLVDYGAFFASKTLLFGRMGDAGVYVATAAGFTLGLVYNYVFSVVFVFRSAREQNRGKSAGAFLLFAAIGAAGLLLSEGGMALFFGVIGIHYLVSRAIVSGLVLIWNYGARKLLIFR